MSESALLFKKPVELRDRFRNLEAVVQIALETNEDPIVLASASGVSPSALIRALPRKYLTQFVANAEGMSIQEVILALAANHALDVAVEGLVSREVDAKSTLVTARDVMDRVSLLGAKKVAPTRRLELPDETIQKFLELERVFTQTGLANGEIAPEFADFQKTHTQGHRDRDGGRGKEEKETHDQILQRAAEKESWARKQEPQIREILNLDDD